MWRENTSPKQKLFLWKMARGALPLGDELHRRGINVSGLCPHCLEPENAIHLFFDCPFARQVWDLAPLSVTPNFDHVTTLHEAFTIMATAICLPPTGIAGNLTSWLLWNIWTSRNLLVFENRVVIAKVAVGKAILSAREWLAAQVTTPPPCTDNPPNRNSPLPRHRCDLVQHGCSLGCKQP